MIALAFTALVVGSAMTIAGIIGSSWYLAIAAPFAASFAVFVTGAVLSMLGRNGDIAYADAETAVILEELNGEMAGKLRDVAARMGQAKEAFEVRRFGVDSPSEPGGRKTG